MADQENGDRYRVAFDLMVQIAKSEGAFKPGEEKTREYWLKLYRESFNAVKGAPMNFSPEVLEKL